MKSYPSITTKIDFGKKWYLFDKLDGSNIRAEWSKKSGFYKFGSRTQLLTPDQTTLYPAIERINNFVSASGESIHKTLERLKVESVVCFFEWVGPKSFAGTHYDEPDDMEVVLIDVSLYKRGLMRPESFIETFPEFRIPKVLHIGKIPEELFQSVRNMTLEGITFEGVVGKEAGCTKDGRHEMCKIKTNAWLDALKERCNGNDELFNRLK